MNLAALAIKGHSYGDIVGVRVKSRLLLHLKSAIHHKTACGGFLFSCKHLQLHNNDSQTVLLIQVDI